MGGCLSSPPEQSGSVTPLNKKYIIHNHILPNQMSMQLRAMEVSVKQCSKMTNPLLIRQVQQLYGKENTQILLKFKNKAVECSSEEMMNQVLYFYEKTSQMDYKLEKLWFITEHNHLSELGRGLILQQHLKDIREGYKREKKILKETLTFTSLVAIGES